MESIKVLHDRIEISVRPLEEHSWKEIFCKIITRTSVLSHLMLTFYVADISEVEDLLELKRDSRTNSRCYLCETKKMILLLLLVLLSDSCAKRKVLLSPSTVALQEIRQKAKSKYYLGSLCFRCFNRFRWSKLTLAWIALPFSGSSQCACCILESVGS